MTNKPQELLIRLGRILIGEMTQQQKLNTKITVESDYSTDDTSEEQNDTILGRSLKMDIPADRETQEDDQTTSSL